jgi:hypothetical protein
VAVIDEAVVQIAPDFARFRTKLEAGLKAATKGVEAEVRVVPDVSRFTKDLDKILRSRAFNAGMAEVAAKVRVLPNLGRFGDETQKALNNYAPLQRVRAKVKLVADCRTLIRSVNDCLEGSGVQAAKTVAENVRRAASRTKVTVSLDVDTEEAEEAVDASGQKITRALLKRYRNLQEQYEHAIAATSEQAALNELRRTRSAAEQAQQVRLLAHEAALKEVQRREDEAALKTVARFRNVAERIERETTKAWEDAHAERQRREDDACRKNLKRARDCAEEAELAMLRAHEAGLQEQRRLDDEAILRPVQRTRDAAERLEREMAKAWNDAHAEQTRREDKAAREADRRAKERAAALKDLFGGSELFGGLIDLGRPGIRPMNALFAVAALAGPAIIAVAASAAKASLSLTAFGAAALGAASTVGVLAFAFHGIGDALDNYQKAMDGSAAASEKLAAQLAAMTPAARGLFDELIDIKTEMAGFARLAQTEVLPGVTALLRLIRQRPAGGASAVDILKVGMLDLGKIITDTNVRIGQFAASEFFKTHLADIVNENTAAFGNLADAAVALLRPITRIFTSAAPLLTRFTAYLEHLADRFADFVDGFTDAQLDAFFADVGDEMARWAHLAEQLIGLLIGIGRASADAGGTLVDRLTEWVRKANEWVNGPGFAQIQEFFQFFADLNYGNIATGLTAIAGGLAAVRGARLLLAGGAGGLFGAAEAGAAGAGAAGSLGNLPRLLGAVKFGVFAVGAAFVTAYIESEQFRDSVNGIAETFTDSLTPGVQEAGEHIKAAFGGSNDDLAAFGSALEDVGLIAAKVAGTAVGEVIAEVAYGIEQLAKLAKDGAELLRNLRDAQSATITPQSPWQDRFEKWLTDQIDRGLDWLTGTERRMAAIAATSSVFNSQVPALARGATRTPQAQRDFDEAMGAGQAAEAQKALDDALAHSASSAARYGDALAAANSEVRDAAIAARDAQWAISDARKAIVEGQREEVEAQRAITQARRDAADAIADLRAQVRGLAVDEREARFKLAVAREARKGFEYTAAIDPLVRERLDLDVAQAENDLSEKVRDGARARRDLAEAERRGVDGHEQVIAARQRLRDVQEQNLQRERDLTKAQEGATRAVDDLRLATQRRTKAAEDSRVAAEKEAAAVDAARKTYTDLRTAQDKVKPKVEAKVNIIPFVASPVGPRDGNRPAKDVAPGGYAIVPIGPPKPAGKLPSVNGVIGPWNIQTSKAGGPIWGPGDGTSDSVPIWASKGEFMQPARTVDYYGSGAMEAIRRRAIPRDALRGYAAGGMVLDEDAARAVGAVTGAQYAMGYVNRHLNAFGAAVKLPPVITNFLVPVQALYSALGDMATIAGSGKWPLGGPWPPGPYAQRGDSGIWQQLLSLVKSTGIRHEFGNAFRAGSELWHGSGRAIDFTGYNQDDLAAFFMSIKDRVLELIHTTDSGGYYITRGVRQNSMGEQDALHRDHLHVAMDSGGWLPPGDTLVRNRTGKPETVRTAGQEAALRNVRLDRRDLQLLAAYIAQASARPLNIDGRRVAEAVRSYDYLPPGV